MTSDVERTIVEPAAEQARDNRSHRIIIGAIIMLMAFSLVLGGLFLAIRSQEADTRAELATVTATANRAIDAANTNADKVKQLGGVPVEVPAAPPAAPGQNGAQGPRGEQGLIGPQGAQGVPGIQGVMGAMGIPGTPGADSSVPGPAGPQGKQGDPGVAGPAGAQGDPGATGPKGDPGPTPTATAFMLDPSGACVFVTTYSNGVQLAAPAPAAQCIAVPPTALFRGR